MDATSLTPRAVEKVWGRRRLPDGFAAMAGGAAPIGEIWFEAPANQEPELLVKYLFTSERLSIQVHPDDAAARALGHRRGKDEAWLILEAEPGAVIGLGPKRPVTAGELRRAALDGTIVDLVDWRPVAAGDFIYSPAGTVHAIGGGLSLIELQQNCDVTHRLYDYGRPRDLHLDAALAVALLEPWRPIYQPRRLAPGRELLATGAAFTVERWSVDAPLVLEARQLDVTLIPLAGAGSLEGRPLRQTQVVAAQGTGSVLAAPALDLLVAYPGPVRLNLAQRDRRRTPRNVEQRAFKGA